MPPYLQRKTNTTFVTRAYDAKSKLIWGGLLHLEIIKIKHHRLVRLQMENSIAWIVLVSPTWSFYIVIWKNHSFLTLVPVGICKLQRGANDQICLSQVMCARTIPLRGWIKRKDLLRMHVWAQPIELLMQPNRLHLLMWSTVAKGLLMTSMKKSRRCRRRHWSRCSLCSETSLNRCEGWNSRNLACEMPPKGLRGIKRFIVRVWELTQRWTSRL